ncbi:MAG: ABC transporter ATP-binding protein [Cytophagaceae bacterium]
MSVLEVNNLRLGYSQTAVLERLSFSIDTPSFVAIVGHNGCGKSTFLKAMTGNISYSGDIIFPSNFSDLKASNFIGYLEQKNSITFDLPVKEILVLGLFRRKGIWGTFGKDDYRLVYEKLGELGYQYLFEKSMLQLSGGEQQIVWLVQLMIQDSPLLLLDEPTQHLDIFNKKITFDLMRKWVNEMGKTVFCVTHDLDFLECMSGYIINFSASEIKPELISYDAVRRHKNMLMNKEVSGMNS